MMMNNKRPGCKPLPTPCQGQWISLWPGFFVLSVRFILCALYNLFRKIFYSSVLIFFLREVASRPENSLLAVIIRYICLVSFPDKLRVRQKKLIFGTYNETYPGWILYWQTRNLMHTLSSYGKATGEAEDPLFTRVSGTPATHFHVKNSHFLTRQRMYKRLEFVTL